MIERLTWDSDHFGLPIGRVVGSRVNAADLAEADQLGLQCLYLLVQAADASAIAAAEGLGFRVIDERITLGRTLTGRKPAASDSAELLAVRPAVTSDLVALEPIARTAHTDSRFFADRNFDREAAAMLYVAWLRKSLAGELADIVFVVDDAGDPAGYITGQIDPDGTTVAIGLFAVAESARGRGLGSRLLAMLLATAAQRRVRNVTVVTQGNNVAARRVYQSAGFRTIKSEVWLHRWALVPPRAPEGRGIR